jgi:hypothetical protein
MLVIFRKEEKALAYTLDISVTSRIIKTNFYKTIISLWGDDDINLYICVTDASDNFFR